MYRIGRITALVSLGIASTLFVASRTTKNPLKSAAASAAEAVPASGEYTLRIVFDGLAPLWAPNSSSSPGEIIFFTGPRSPEQFAVGNEMPPHLTHILVQSRKDSSGNEEIKTSGRTLTDPLPFRHGDDIALPGVWRQADLEGEDLTLEATTSTPLKLGSLAAVFNLPQELDKIPGGTLADKSLKKCLTESTVSCPGLRSQLSSRFRLQNGTVSADKLKVHQGEVLKFTMGGPGRPLTENVVVELKVRESVKFHSRSLVDGQEKSTLVVEGRPGQVVEVHVANHPTCMSDEDCGHRFANGDFMFPYNLIGNPQFISSGMLPMPKRVVAGVTTDSPGFNGQCSPTSLIR